MVIYLNDALQGILYFLGSILIVALIVLVIKMIKTLKKVDNVVNDIDEKQKKLDGLFDIVDGATDALSTISDKVVGTIVNGLVSLFSRKKKEENEDE